MVFALVAGFTVAVPVIAPTPAEARFAEGGIGRYGELIDWFEWGEPGQLLQGDETPGLGAGTCSMSCTTSVGPEHRTN